MGGIKTLGQARAPMTMDEILQVRSLIGVHKAGDAFHSPFCGARGCLLMATWSIGLTACITWGTATCGRDLQPSAVSMKHFLSFLLQCAIEHSSITETELKTLQSRFVCDISGG